MSGKVTKTLRERFEARWTPEPYSGCWLWNSAGAKFEYGKIQVNGKLEMATRVSWFLKYGEWPPAEMLMCHRCDTPSCVNPLHLFQGTYRDNTLDAIRKGRRVYTRGYGVDWTVQRSRRRVRKLRSHCLRGHPFSGENLYLTPNGTAGCKECRRQQVYAFKRRQAAK